MGKGLLDITKPFKEASPSPDQPSGEATSAQTPNLAEKKKPAQEGAESHAEVTIVPAPMEVSEETLNEVGLRITPENGHVAPLLVGTPREEKVVESVAHRSGQPMPPSVSNDEGQGLAPVVLLMMPESDQQQQQQQQQPQVQPDGTVHIQALIPATVTSGDLGEGHDPGAVLDVKVIPQREAEDVGESEREREQSSSSFVSRGESSFVAEGAPGEQKKPVPPIVQLESVSPRGETFASPIPAREAIAAPRRSVSELSAPVFARLDLLALMKGRARSAMVPKQSGKPASVPTVARKKQQEPPGLQREGTGVSAMSDGVAPLTGRTPLGLDAIDIDVTTPRNVAQVDLRGIPQKHAQKLTVQWSVSKDNEHCTIFFYYLV